MTDEWQRLPTADECLSLSDECLSFSPTTWRSVRTPVAKRKVPRSEALTCLKKPSKFGILSEHRYYYMSKKTFQVAMLPWFAMGHLIPYINICNRLAQRGHRIFFFMPINTIPKFHHLNLHPELITFVPVTVPHVDGLPPGSETTADVSYALHTLIMTAMDLTKPSIEASLKHLKPHFVFSDLAHWIPALARSLGIKSVSYVPVSPATVAYLFAPERKYNEKPLTQSELMQQPLGYPASSIRLRSYEARAAVGLGVNDFGDGISFAERVLISIRDCDAISFKTCTEIEGPFCDYIEKQFKKTVILAGPVVPDPPPATNLEERWEKWLRSFEQKTVIFCSFGSECILGKEQFQELVLGLELSGMPFFAALKPPLGVEKIECALPAGFLERTRGRGIVYGGWVQQQLLLAHPSVGCNVTHCGYGSLLEAMVNECELVLMPQYGDQIINSRLMGGDLEVGVEVERDKEDGMFTGEGVCKAIRLLMEVDSEVGKKIRANRAKWSQFLSSKSLDSSYIDSFVQKLQGLLG